MSRYYAQVDCRTKDINLCIPGEPVLRLNFKEPPRILEMISRERARKFLRKGAVGYIVYLVNQPKNKVQTEQVPIVKELLDVFSEKLKALPPDREVEFTVDLWPGKSLILKT